MAVTNAVSRPGLTRRMVRALAACLLAAWALPVQALTVQVLGAGGSAGEAYVAALAAALAPEHAVNVEGPADVVVALHEGVLAEARAMQRPLLVLLPDPPAAAPVAGEGALYWAPGWREQLRLARLIFPGLRRAGLLLDSEAELARFQALRPSLAGRDLLLQARLVDPDYPLRDIAELAAANDVLLAPVGSRLFSRDLIKPALLAAYRQNRVFIGGSPAAVRAGTLAALQATPGVLAEETALRIRQRLRDGRWPEPGRVTRFEVLTNPQVARALGLRLPAADVLTRSLRAEEAAP